MSNSLAVAAVTATLRNIIQTGVHDTPDLNDTKVTVQPLDKARGNLSSNQLNVFLYQTVVDAALRNMDPPRQLRSGETGTPPLSLQLYYLITAYGRDNDDLFGHRLLGQAMSVLHDHPLLSPSEIQGALPGADLNLQVERVRLTWQPMSIEELSKLWTAFQTQYRISAAYQVSVVQIDSSVAARTPLPVLTRGPGDTGIVAQGNLLPPFPTIDGVAMPNHQSGARLGDRILLTGHNFGSDAVHARLNHPLLAAPIVVGPLLETTGTSAALTLPTTAPTLPSGIGTLSLLLQTAGKPDRSTNEVALPVVPRIAGAVVAAGTATITVAPEILPEQRASLLIGDREIAADARQASTATLTFNVGTVTPGTYFVRLRVDGVDSLLVDRSKSPAVFDPTQTVTVA